jgi:UDP-glucose 4-epimerase
MKVLITGRQGYVDPIVARHVAAAVPGTIVSINRQAQPDTRFYQVDFSRYSEFAPDHVPRVTLARSISMLREGLEAMGFADPDFRNSSFLRLKLLEGHIRAGGLTNELRWLDGFLDRE